MRGSSVLIRALVVLGVILGAPCLAPNGPAMEVVFPPARHVFRHADEVQFALLFDVASPEVLFDVFGAEATIELEIDWDRRSSFPIDSDLAVSIPSLNEGPHVVRAWVASTRSHAGSAVPSTTATVEFFVWPLPTAPEHGEDEGTGESSVAGGMREMSEEMERWIASLMSMLVQHPPADFVFRSRDALFVEVRVTDKEMQLSLSEAVNLMYSRATVYQQRPYLIAIDVDGVRIGEHRRAKRIMLPQHLADGSHVLSVTLKDVHSTIVATVTQKFSIESTALISSSPSGAGSDKGGDGDGACAHGHDCGEQDRAEWWVCPEDILSSCFGEGRGAEHGECSHHMLTHTHFLPTSDPALGSVPTRHEDAEATGMRGRYSGSSGFGCSAAREYQYGASSLAHQVWRRQFPARCQTSDGSAFRLRVPLQGIGIMLQFLVNGLVEALETNRTMVVHASDWPWLAHPDCGRASLDCYFMPITSCSFPELVAGQHSPEAGKGQDDHGAESSVVELAAKALTKEHIRRAGLATDTQGRPNTNVGLLVPSAVFGRSRGAREAGDAGRSREGPTRAMPDRDDTPGSFRWASGSVGGGEGELGGGGEGEAVRPVVGWFWMRSHLLSFVLRLLPQRSMQVRLLKARLGFPSRGSRGARGEGGGVVGVHIRRGDACAASVGYRTPCQALEVYVEAIRRMTRAYNTSAVFVASDDDDALQRLQRLPGLDVMFVPQDRSMLASHWYVEDRIRHGLLDAALAGESAMMDLFVLASCDYFVGTFSSHFGTLAFELMAAEKGYLPPYLSLDLAWAPRH